MTDNGKMIKLTERESIATSTAPSTKAIGRKINNTGKDWRHGRMVQVMKVDTK